MRSWTTTLGAGLAMTALAGAWRLATSPQPVLSAPALCVVLLFAAGFVLLCHPADELAAVARPVLPTDDLATRRRIVMLAASYRTAGLRGLEREQRSSANPLERRGLRLLVDGAALPELAAAIRLEAADLRAAELAAEAVWRAVARGAINGGVLVSVVQIAAGLTVVPPEQAHLVVAGALGAAVYGNLLGWFIGYPQALRRRRAAAAIAREADLWIDGLAGVAAGVNPRQLADRLNTAELPGMFRVA